jgi:hypothetical protein
MSVNADDLVAAYVAIRAEREKLLREFENSDKQLESELFKIKAALLTTCNEINASSIRTPHGTVIRKLNEKYFCTDWEHFRKFEQEHTDIDFRERRIHQGNFRQFMSENEGAGLPPGVNVLREFDISVRKATSKD